MPWICHEYRQGNSSPSVWSYESIKWSTRWAIQIVPTWKSFSNVKSIVCEEIDWEVCSVGKLREMTKTPQEHNKENSEFLNFMNNGISLFWLELCHRSLSTGTICYSHAYTHCITFLTPIFSNLSNKSNKQIKQTKKSKENKKYISGCSVDILKGNSSVEHITSHSVKDTFGFTSWSTDDQEREMHFS